MLSVRLVPTRHAHDDDPGKRGRGCGNGLVNRRVGVIARGWHETSPGLSVDRIMPLTSSGMSILALTIMYSCSVTLLSLHQRPPVIVAQVPGRRNRTMA